MYVKDYDNLQNPLNVNEHPVLIILDNLRSAFNVGNIFRLAELTGIQGIVTCGYTPTPPHSKLEKTARGCDKLVNTRHFESTCEALTVLKRESFNIIAVETCPDAPNVWDADIKFPVAFLFGNEALGISKDALECCDSFVKLPVYGYKNSMNVGNCVSVILYDMLRRFSL